MKTCNGCILENADDNETCDDCSRIDNDGDEECSCHISPPCSFCVEDNYEEKADMVKINKNANLKPKTKWQRIKERISKLWGKLNGSCNTGKNL